MAASGITISQQSATAIPQPQKGQEHTPSDPMQGKADEPQNSAQLTLDDQTRLIALVCRYKDQWSQDRMILVQRCLLNLEFFKGNQYISFAPGTSQFFDALGWMDSTGGNQNVQNSDDKDLYRYCNNFYQMLATGFIASLCSQVPKSKWLPENAEYLSDVTTAQAAQTLIEVIERQNREQSLLKQQLLYFFTCGSAFRHTRYMVDADRAGTKHEPIFNVTETEILPDRYHCATCGTDSPAADGSAFGGASACPNCGSELGPDSFYPAETGPVVSKVGEAEVPNGMVAQNIYSALDVDCDPAATSLSRTPILNLEMEVHLGALRAAYPDMYDQLSSCATSTLSANGSIDRIARQQIYSETTPYSAILTDRRPTLSRTWIQPWAFDLEDDQDFGKRMRAQFPSGLLLVNVGDTFLCAQEANLVKEWTWAGTQDGFGLYPPAPGEIVVPFQKRYNDMANILHEFMDRCSSGLVLANVDLIDTQTLQGKPPLPGVLNPVKLKRTGAPGSTTLSDALFQFQFQMHEEAFNYLNSLATNAQMFAGVPPQVYGGAGDKNIQTFGGQQQQLNVALGKLNINWENLREEHAQADQLAVGCARSNMTEDLRQVVEEKGSEFRNNYVRLDDLQGNVFAYPDTDQGLPVSAPELRQRWMDLIEAAEKNPMIQAIFDDPSNQEQAANALGVPGMVVPGYAMRAKVLQIIDRLIKAEPIPVTDPQTGEPTGQLQPSIMPDKDIDDFDIARAVIRLYCQENYDLAEDNPAGFQNVLAYLTAVVAAQTQAGVEAAQQKATVMQAGAPQPQQKEPPIPPDEINEVVGTLNNLMTLPPQATAGNIQGQVAAAGNLIKIGTALGK